MPKTKSRPARRGQAEGQNRGDAATDRCFNYRSGVRLTGTTVACDPLRSANEVVFLSHALPAQHGQARNPLAGHHAVRQVLLTEATLALLGHEGRRSDFQALVCDYGRPFSLGDLRIELVPSGYAPGSAALLCRRQDRYLMYTGPLRVGAPAPGARETQIRPADAICVDATYGNPQCVFPPRAEACDQAVAFVQHQLQAGRWPVLLIDEPAVLAELMNAFSSAGVPLRGHAQFAALNNRMRAAGTNLAALPRWQTRQSKPDGGILWPLHTRAPDPRHQIPDAAVALVSGLAIQDDARTRIGADAAIALTARSGYDELLAYIHATGAREIATVNGHAETFAAHLRVLGYHAYSLGPPHQIALFTTRS